MSINVIMFDRKCNIKLLKSITKRHAKCHAKHCSSLKHLAFSLTLLLTILFIATCLYCAPDDSDSDDKCDFERLLRCIQHSRGVRDITSDDDFKLSFRCKCSAKTFRFSGIHHRLYVLKRHVCQERHKVKTGWTITKAGKDRSRSFQVVESRPPGNLLISRFIKTVQRSTCTTTKERAIAKHQSHFAYK